AVERSECVPARHCRVGSPRLGQGALVRYLHGGVDGGIPVADAGEERLRDLGRRGGLGADGPRDGDRRRVEQSVDGRLWHMLCREMRTGGVSVTADAGSPGLAKASPGVPLRRGSRDAARGAMCRMCKMCNYHRLEVSAACSTTTHCHCARSSDAGPWNCGGSGSRTPGRASFPSTCSQCSPCRRWFPCPSRATTSCC